MSQNIHETRQRLRGRSRKLEEKQPHPLRAPEKKSKFPPILVKILVFAIAEVFALGLIFVYAYGLKQYNKIQRPDVNVENVKNQELSIEKIRQMEEGYWNIAVFGVDSRDNSVDAGWNSDVNIVVSINKGTGEIRMTSVYRDTYMDTGYGKYNKINNAYAVGGPEQALKAINKNLDLNITDYMTFNWRAVATAINILGGVDVEITKAEFKYLNSYITDTVKGTGLGSNHISQPGMNHLDGVQAVAYARLRYMDSDFERTERQRRIIQLAFDKAKKADLKTKNDLLGNMLSMVATNMTWQDGLDFIARADMYHIGETNGFPYTKFGANVRGKGDCVVPKTLASNVVELHKFLFEDEEYKVSNTVSEISYRIQSDASSSKNYEFEQSNTKKTTQKTSETSESDSSSKSSQNATNENGRAFETNRNGETIWLDENLDPDFGTDAPTNPSNRGPGITTSDATLVPDSSTKAGQSTQSSTSSQSQSTATTIAPSSAGSTLAPGNTTVAPQPTTAQPITTQPTTPASSAAQGPGATIGPAPTAEEIGPGVGN